MMNLQSKNKCHQLLPNILSAIEEKNSMKDTQCHNEKGKPFIHPFGKNKKNYEQNLINEKEKISHVTQANFTTGGKKNGVFTHF